MGFGLLAVVSGAVLYIASTAVLALQAAGGSMLWWLALGVVALCHAGSGFLTLGRVQPLAEGQAAAATGAAVSLGITGIVAFAALLLGAAFPVRLAPDTAMMLVGVALAAAAGMLAVAVSRRSPGTAGRQQGEPR